MAILDFKEIPEAGKASGKQDTFELFARDVLRIIGFKILQGPARGADLGKDLIVEETRAGLIDSTKVKWLVSCKHFAFSGRSVSLDDEKNVVERVNAAGCDGFLGFYSTLPSAGLSETLHRQSRVLVAFLDRAEIEGKLVASSTGRELIERYFPVSMTKLKRSPAKIFADSVGIECDNCGKDLLNPPSGIWVLWYAREDSEADERKRRYVDLHFACKGRCDRILEDRIRHRHAARGFVYDGWNDIPDMAVPTVFIKQVMAVLNGLNRNDEYEPKPFDRLKHLILATFPLVSRHLTDEDQVTLNRLQRIPSYLGGMGYESEE